MTELTGRVWDTGVVVRVRGGYVAGTPELAVELLEEAIAAGAVVADVTPTGPTLPVTADDPLACAVWLEREVGVVWDEATADAISADQRLQLPDGAIP